MDEIVKKKLEEFEKKAKESKLQSKPTLHGRSSLHQIIKTKEQADRFMKALKSA